MTAPECDPPNAGFTLLETIIAFLILALSLAVVTQTISTAGLAFRRAGDLGRAALVMKELSADTIPALQEAGERSGLVGASRWKITARDFSGHLPGKLLAMEVQIWPRGTEGPAYSYATFSTPGRTE